MLRKKLCGYDLILCTTFLFMILFIVCLAVKSPILSAFTICIGIPLIVEAFDYINEVIGAAGFLYGILGLAILPYFIFTAGKNLQALLWYVILVEILYIYSKKREYAMLVIAFPVFVSIICGIVLKYCIGLEVFLSTIIATFFLFLLLVVFVLRSDFNKEDLFYITRLPLTPLFYLHQNAIIFRKGFSFTYLRNTYLVPELCGYKSNLVKYEFEKVARKLKPDRVYLAETHSAMLEKLKNSNSNIKIIICIPAFSFKVTDSFKSIYIHCKDCRERDRENCRYSYLKKRKAYIVLFRVRSIAKVS